jgi:hypothetical protein
MSCPLVAGCWATCVAGAARIDVTFLCQRHYLNTAFCPFLAFCAPNRTISDSVVAMQQVDAQLLGVSLVMWAEMAES